MGIVALYVFLIPLVFIFIPGSLNYNFAYDKLALAIMAIACVFFAIFIWRFKKFSDFKFSTVFKAALYGLIFAFPEETIFRGIIQGFFQAQYSNPAIAILLSSLVFGIAHLPNGAKSFNSRDWNWKFAAVAFLAGLPLGLMFALTQSLLLSILLHILFTMYIKLVE